MSNRSRYFTKSQDLPYCDLDRDKLSFREARIRMENFIETNRRLNIRAVKIIHGYGSTGVGGTNRIRLRNELVKMKEQGRIRDFIPGEKFNSKGKLNKQYLNDFRQLKNDSTFEKRNEGITIVIL